jgi:hypothetical protein
MKKRNHSPHVGMDKSEVYGKNRPSPMHGNPKKGRKKKRSMRRG